MATRRKNSPDFWAEHCQRWAESSLTQADYCIANKINLKSFSRWRSIFKRQSKTTSLVQKRSTGPRLVLDMPNVERSRRVEAKDATKQAGITLHPVHRLMADASLGAKK